MSCGFSRLFLVHGDGSAVELLSSQRVEEELRQAQSDPAAAVLREPLPDCPGWRHRRHPEPFRGPLTGPRPSFPGEFGITVLKPGPRSLWSQWIVGKHAPDITPDNLRNRPWADFPQTEVSAWSRGGRA